MSIAVASPATTANTPIQPAAPAFGFKDWSLVCSALGEGRQSLILRKGGIAEGRDGFRFKHESFFLFPTQYHQQAERVRPEILADLMTPPPAPSGTIAIRYFFVVDWALWIDDWSALQRLEVFHIYREEVGPRAFRIRRSARSAMRVRAGSIASPRPGRSLIVRPLAAAVRGSPSLNSLRTPRRCNRFWMTPGTLRSPPKSVRSSHDEKIHFPAGGRCQFSRFHIDGIGS